MQIKLGREMEALKAGGGDDVEVQVKIAELSAKIPQPEDDRVQCPHCQRKFNPVTAKRHIPICAETVNRPAPPGMRPKTPKRRLVNKSKSFIQYDHDDESR